MLLEVPTIADAAVTALHTYTRVIHHCLLAKPVATSKRARPAREIVGEMASGPMYLSIQPMAPVKPMTTWKIDATMVAPWICTDNMQFRKYKNVVIQQVASDLHTIVLAFLVKDPAQARNVWCENLVLNVGDSVFLMAPMFTLMSIT